MPAASDEPTGIRLPYVMPAIIAVASKLRKKEIWRVATTQKVVALTFDDGPSAQYLAEVLDVLEREKVPATFFWLGDRLPETESEKSLQRRANVLRAAQAGHEMAYHGWRHESVSKQRGGGFTTDLTRFRQELGDLLPRELHRKVRFFRPPFGHMETYVHRGMKLEKMQLVEAHVLPGDRYLFPDYFLEDEHRAVERTVRDARPGSVICLHVGEDVGKNDKVYNAVHAAKIVAALIPRLRELGFGFVTMTELAALPAK